mgnify:CR=1 FL=1
MSSIKQELAKQRKWKILLVTKTTSRWSWSHQRRVQSNRNQKAYGREIANAVLAMLSHLHEECHRLHHCQKEEMAWALRKVRLHSFSSARRRNMSNLPEWRSTRDSSRMLSIFPRKICFRWRGCKPLRNDWKSLECWSPNEWNWKNKRLRKSLRTFVTLWRLKQLLSQIACATVFELVALLRTTTPDEKALSYQRYHNILHLQLRIKTFWPPICSPKTTKCLEVEWTQPCRI